MNHIKLKLVRVKCPEKRNCIIVSFESIEEQKYSEEDLDVHGELNLCEKDFSEFIHNYFKYRS